MFTIDLSGKVAVIMGVANHRSIGWGIAQCLHKAGASSAFTYVGEKFGQTLSKLTEDLGQPKLYECDVADDAAIDRTFAAIGKDFGKIDILVHSIAFAPRDALEGRYLDTERDAFRTALDISAFSLVRVARAAHPLMKEQGGAIVTLSYLAAERAVPRYNVMGTAKAALEQAVRQLAYELGPDNIRVNAISAGPVNTLSARGVKDFTNMLGLVRDKAPLKRSITLEEIGTAALFLLTDMGGGVTGETLYVDAGYNIMGM